MQTMQKNMPPSKKNAVIAVISVACLIQAPGSHPGHDNGAFPPRS
jgi:hypothetical protein